MVAPRKNGIDPEIRTGPHRHPIHFKADAAHRYGVYPPEKFGTKTADNALNAKETVTLIGMHKLSNFNFQLSLKPHVSLVKMALAVNGSQSNGNTSTITSVTRKISPVAKDTPYTTFWVCHST
jgi:hypothetical protein